jgi:histidinol-phosphate aminotransferase
VPKNALEDLEMSRFWNEKTRRIEPYVAGEQPADPSEWIKINTNENPYPPSQAVAQAILNELSVDIDTCASDVDVGDACGNGVCGESLRFYPSPNADIFVDAVCQRFGLKKEQVFAGNGSDEILAFSFMAFWDESRPVKSPAVSYSFYPVYAGVFNVPYVPESKLIVRPSSAAERVAL